MSQSALPFLALSAAAALSFAGYSASQSSAYYAAQGQIQNLADCSSFSLASWGDPHVTGQVGNGPVSMLTNGANESDLTTLANTAQGPTQVSTTAEPGLNSTFVDGSVTVQHGGSGANAWSLRTTEKDGVVQATLTDANGIHHFGTENVGTTFSEPDGTKIIVTQAPTQIAGAGKYDVVGVHVLQALSAGGYIDTAILANNSYAGGWPGLTVLTQGRGNAVINGATSVEATGSENADLPCIQPQTASNVPSSSGGNDAGGPSQARS